MATPDRPLDAESAHLRAMGYDEAEIREFSLRRYMQRMLWSLFLVNGGSAVGLLTAFGKFNGAGGAMAQPDAAEAAIFRFALGAAFATFAAAFAAILEIWNADRLERGEKCLTWLVYVLVVFIGLSIISFVMACAAAISAITAKV